MQKDLRTVLPKDDLQDKIIKMLKVGNHRQKIKIVNDAKLKESVINQNISKELHLIKSAEAKKKELSSLPNYLGKRSSYTFKVKDVYDKDRPKYEKMAARHRKRMEEEEEFEMEYRRKWRLIVEKWKHRLIEKFPFSVSFKVHNLGKIKGE